MYQKIESSNPKILETLQSILKKCCWNNKLVPRHDNKMIFDVYSGMMNKLITHVILKVKHNLLIEKFSMQDFPGKGFSFFANSSISLN